MLKRGRGMFGLILGVFEQFFDETVMLLAREGGNMDTLHRGRDSGL